jgi:hypothetical protein
MTTHEDIQHSFETGLRSGDWFFDYGKVIGTSEIPGFANLTGLLVEFEVGDGEPPYRVELVYNAEQLAQLPQQMREFQQQKIADSVDE